MTDSFQAGISSGALVGPLFAVGVDLWGQLTAAVSPSLLQAPPPRLALIFLLFVFLWPYFHAYLVHTLCSGLSCLNPFWNREEYIYVHSIPVVSSTEGELYFPFLDSKFWGDLITWVLSNLSLWPSENICNCDLGDLPENLPFVVIKMYSY